MAKVLIRVNVAYVSDFTGAYERQANERRELGERHFTFGVDENAHNVVYVIADWASVATAKKFWGSNMATNQMTEWRSVDEPKIIILRENAED